MRVARTCSGRGAGNQGVSRRKYAIRKCYALYSHEATVLLGKDKDAACRFPPRVHRVASLLKRWLLGTHQGAVHSEHLDYYLDEFTFRFNRRTSKSRGEMFYRLLEQAVQIDAVPYEQIVGGRPMPTPNHNI